MQSGTMSSFPCSAQQYRRRLHRAMVTGIAVGVTACGGHLRVVEAPQATQRHFGSVAVLELHADNSSLAGRGADGCSAALLATGVQVIERQRVASLLQERGMGRVGELRPADFQRLGQMLGADGFIAGSITPGRHNGASAVTARLVSAASGSVVRIVDYVSDDWDDAFDAGSRVCRAIVGGANR